jgi:6,7-dimethyl-8-ribityllumazine synthase
MANKPRCAIVAADFARSIVDVMVAEARSAAAVLSCELLDTVRVSGAYEIPLVADVLLARTDVDFLVVLGFIERGETQHGEVMGHVVQQTLVDLQLKHRKPVGIGLIGPGATTEQAEKRKVDYARAAVKAALQSWNYLEKVELSRP